MAEIELFDRSGQAVAYSHDGEHIHLWDGKPVAFLHQGKVYADCVEKLAVGLGLSLSL